MNCPTIPEDKRKTRDEFDREFAESRGRIFAALLDKLSEGLRNVDHVQIDRLPRMADFAKFGFAAFGEEFLKRYRELLGEANSVALNSSLVGTLVLQYMENRDRWQGTASQLLDALDSIADERTRFSKYFPKQASSLSGSLNRIAPNLRAEGLEFERGVGRERRQVILVNTRKTVSPASPASPANEDQY